LAKRSQAVLVLMAVLALLEPVFLTPRNIGNVLAQTAVISVLAMGQFMVIVSRGIDLSVGATVALASVVGALAFSTIDLGLAIVVVMVVTGLAVGMTNGFILVKGRMPHPFIVTLATMSVARGLALWLAEGRSTVPGGTPEVIRFLLDEEHPRRGVRLSACHPNDVLSRVVEICKYEGVPPRLDNDLVERACRDYFTEL